MNFRIAILGCFALFSGILGKVSRIIGGELATINEFPYHVGFKLLTRNLFICSGAIITERHILSAAHCFKDKQHLYDDIRAFTSTNDLNSIANLYRIVRFDVHPLYTGESSTSETFIHDISVLTLENVLRFSQTQNKIALPTENSRVNVNGLIAGWGKISLSALVPSNDLKKITVRIISKQDCRGHFQQNIHSSQMCVLQPEGIGAYQGDSGGPLVSFGKVVGILSWIVAGIKSYPDVYTDVYKHTNFINAIIHRPS